MTPSPDNEGPRHALLVHPGAELYGSDRVLLESADALIRGGWRVTVVVPQSGPLVHLAEQLGASVKIVRMPVLRKSGLTPKGAASLFVATAMSLVPSLRMLRRIQPDVVYVSTVTIPSWPLLARATRAQVVCHVHEAEVEAPRALRWAMALPLLLAKVVIANSSFSRQALLDVIPRLAPRTVVIPNPVTGPTEVTEPRTALEPPVAILYLGRLSPRKGPQVLLQAVSRLRDQGRVCELTLLGSVFPGYEWFASELRALVEELHLSDVVTFRGFCENVWQDISSADIVAVPSITPEPFGNAAVEAVLAARPVVVSACGGLTEAVAGFESALSVPPDDPDMLATELGRIMDGWPKYAEAARSDADAARARHSPRVYHEQVMRIFRDVGGKAR